MVKYNMDKSYAREEGLKERLQKELHNGKEEGLREGKKEMARNMLKDNVDITIISKYTGLTIEKIQELIK